MGTIKMEAKQEKLNELQPELDKLESRIQDSEKISEEDTKFIAELGWLSAAAVAIASIAVNL